MCVGVPPCWWRRLSLCSSLHRGAAIPPMSPGPDGACHRVDGPLGAGDGAGGPESRIDETVRAGSGSVTFSEFPWAAAIPYMPPRLCGGATSPMSPFGGFVGQMLGDATSCPPDAALTGCVIGSASAPLTDPASPPTSIVNDSANPTRPCLAARRCSILFDRHPVRYRSGRRGSRRGYFDDIGAWPSPPSPVTDRSWFGGERAGRD